MVLMKRGRPRKEVDPGIISHMLQNGAPIAVISKHVGVSRDTIYANYGDVIRQARISNNELMRKRIHERLAEIL